MSWIQITQNLYINDTAPYTLEKIESIWYVIDNKDKSKFLPISDIYNNPVFPIDLQNQDVLVKSLQALNGISGNSLDITNNAKAKHFRGELSNTPDTPSFSSQGDPDTGFYHISSGKFGFSSNGIKTLEFDQNLTVFNKSNLMPVGTIIQSVLLNPPSGFLLCDGAEYSRTSYSDLFSVMPSFTNTITLTIASPCVVTWTNHGLATGQSIQFSTNGALPTGIVAGTIYYIRKINDNTFHLYNSLSNAMNINATTGIINTSGTQSGTHTALSYLYGNGDGITTFNIPDLRGASPRGAGTSAGYIEPATLSLGEKTDDQFQSHLHNIFGSGHTSGSTVSYLGLNSGNRATSSPITDTTFGTPRAGKETRSKTQAFNFYIKF